MEGKHERHKPESHSRIQMEQLVQLRCFRKRLQNSEHRPSREKLWREISRQTVHKHWNYYPLQNILIISWLRWFLYSKTHLNTSWRASSRRIVQSLIWFSCRWSELFGRPRTPGSRRCESCLASHQSVGWSLHLLQNVWRRLPWSSEEQTQRKTCKRCFEFFVYIEL